MHLKPAVDHGDAPGCEGYPPATDPDDLLAFSRRLIGRTVLCCELRRGGFKLTPAKCVEKVADENDALALAACEPFFNQVVDAGIHCLTHLTNECVHELGLKTGVKINAMRTQCHFAQQRQFSAMTVDEITALKPSVAILADPKAA